MRPTTRRRPPTWLLALAVLAAIAVPTAAWALGAGAIAADVAVVAAGPPDCVGATWRTDEEEAQDVLVVTPRTRCVYAFDITNRSRVGVHLETLVLPYLGTDGGAVVRSASVDRGDAVNATSPLDRDLEAGGTTRVEAVVTYRPDGCTSSVTTLGSWPMVEITSLGRGSTVHGADSLAFTFAEEQNPGCRP